MKTKLFLILSMVCMGLTQSYAQETDISSLDYAVYVSSTAVLSDNQATLSLNMKNLEEAIGFQCNVYFPDEITLSNAELSEARTTKENTDFFKYALQSDGSYLILCSSTESKAFADNDGEVSILTLAVPDSYKAGDTFTVTFKEIEITDVNVTAHRPGEIVCKVTLVDETYDEGYDVDIAPITLGTSGGESTSSDIYFNVDASAVQGTVVDFDVVFPTEWYNNFMIADVVKNSSLNTRFYTVTEPKDNEDGSYHFTLTAKNANYYFGKVASTKIGSFTIYQDGGGDDGTYVIADGFYPIIIKNVVVKDKDGNAYSPAPSTTYVKVGEPTSGSLTLSGRLSSAVNEALATETGLTSIDLSDVVQMEGTFTVVDGRNFVGPKKDVTVTKATYSRAMTNKWGTICLPYEVKTDATASYYQVTGIDGDVLTITEYTTLPAGTPALVYNAETGIEPTSENVVVNGKLNTVTTDVTMIGKYTQDNQITDANAYYIKRNQFNRCNGNFYIDAYRAYFTTSATEAKVLNIEDITDALNALSGNGDVTIKAIYTVDGVIQNTLQKGMNIVVLSNGKTQKVMVK